MTRASSFLGKAALPAFGILVAGYFIYHTLEGRHGILAYTDLTRKEEALSPKVAELKARRAELERRVSLLRPNALDLDMLDESARRKLAFVQKGDRIIPLDGHNQQVINPDD